MDVANPNIDLEQDFFVEVAAGTALFGLGVAGVKFLRECFGLYHDVKTAKWPSNITPKDTYKSAIAKINAAKAFKSSAKAKAFSKKVAAGAKAHRRKMEEM